MNKKIIQHWLLKSEPDTYSIDDLINAPSHITPWEGVRNYQARNFLRAMKVGDLGFFYHSSCAVPGIVGIVEIVRAAYPDETARNPQSLYYDAKSSFENPRWFCVDVRFMKKFKSLISLQSLKADPRLKKMRLLQKGNRLSVLPISFQEWEIINGLLKQ